MQMEMLEAEILKSCTYHQVRSYKKQVKHWGQKPNPMYYDSLLKCLMLGFPGILIGIERDGYTHS